MASFKQQTQPLWWILHILLLDLRKQKQCRRNRNKTLNKCSDSNVSLHLWRKDDHRNQRDVHQEKWQWLSPLSEAASPSESPPSFNIDGTHKCSSVAAFQSLRLELTRERKVSVEGARWESRFRCREGEPMHSYRVWNNLCTCEGKYSLSPM